MLKIAYKLVILVIFPLYPACSLLAELFRLTQAWRRDGWHEPVFLLSRIIGVRVYPDQGRPSEALDNRHLWQYSWTRRRSRTYVKIALVLTLLLTTSQSLGTLVRTISRLFIDQFHRGPNMKAFLAEDFESFFLSIGVLAVLIKSWLALAVNAEWRSDPVNASRSVDISMSAPRRRRTSIFSERHSQLLPSEIVSEIFLEFQTRFLVVLALYLICWIVLGIITRNACVLVIIHRTHLTNEARLVVFAASTAVTVLAIAWLRRSEAEAVPGGKEVFVSGFCACIIFLFPRAKFYISDVEHADENMSVSLLLFSLAETEMIMYRVAYIHAAC